VITTAIDRAVSAVRHWHVIESDPGCLPEADPYVIDDVDLALDAAAHLLAGWSQDHPDHRDAARAGEVADVWCGCARDGGDAADEYHQTAARLDDGDSVTVVCGNREFAIACCHQRDCWKYCPADDCRTATPIDDPDERCWCCGTTYTPSESCPWLA
jgi:hypothetical protein